MWFASAQCSVALADDQGRTKHLDFSPALKDGDSGGHPPGFLFHRRPPARENSRAGLVPAPQASTASPAALMLTAALISRSYRIPQDSQPHSPTPSGRLAPVCPQAEQTLLEGYQRPVTTRSRPYHSHLYASMARISRHAAATCCTSPERSRWPERRVRCCSSGAKTSYVPVAPARRRRRPRLGLRARAVSAQIGRAHV